MAEAAKYYGTGKRKSAVARVWLAPGSGKITVNSHPAEDYITATEASKGMIHQPLQLTNMLNKLDVTINVSGGGICGQASAIRHGISRALLEYNPDLRSVLKKAGLLTRDSRIKERKKYGQRGARARFQFSKR